MGSFANNRASHPVRAKIVGAVDGEQVNQSRTRAVHPALDGANGAAVQCRGVVVGDLRSARLVLSRVNKLRRHFGFSFVDNNTATSCCHGSVLYSGSIFCEM
jgi:hypothetical protein